VDAVYDAAVIGGGFFGATIASHLRRHFDRVVLLEREVDLLQRASFANQARVHNGYHYPRSLLTALRSRINFPRFLRDYPDCIDRGFDKVYAISRQFSNVTATYFELICRRIEAPLRPAPLRIARLFNPETIEAVFLVEEVAFDAVRLREHVRRELDESGVEVRLETNVRRVSSSADGLKLALETPAGESELRARQVFNCTYAVINHLLVASGLPPLPLKHELAEMALVEVPEPLRKLGVTVMCGPFFSCMPFPARGLHSLSHVRYTPHGAWSDNRDVPRSGQSNCDEMVRDAARYLPLLRGCRQRDSLWEIKTILPSSETDDSRPILFRKHVGLPNLHCILGAKIDNIYDVLEALDEFVLQRRCG
jgi:glycine/D-amino acid oxidase-like deaminating enzyme